MGQYKILEIGEDLLTLTDCPSKLPTNLEEVYWNAIGDNTTREDMAKIWSTKDLLGRDERELLVWNDRLNY